MLDDAFQALADPTRRAMIGRLAARPMSVTDLAQPFAIGLPTLLKHLKVLERAGLVASHKAGRVRVCNLEPARLEGAEAWLSDQRRAWAAQADRLADYVERNLTEGS